jgi:hypothetical protein
MRIKLNTEVQSMFPLLGLSFENPGPINVDWLKLTPQQQLWVTNALRKSVLLTEDKIPPVAGNIAKAPVSEKPVSKKEEAKQLLQSAEDIRAEKVQQAATTLKVAQAAIVPMVEASKDLVLLRIMKDQESEGKKRKKVLDALTVQILKLESTVGSVVGEPLDNKALLVTDRNLKDLPEVEEEIEEEKTFTINQE